MKKFTKYDTNLKMLVKLENKRINKHEQDIKLLIFDIDLQLNNLIEKLAMFNYSDLFETICLDPELTFIRRIYVNDKSYYFVFSWDDEKLLNILEFTKEIQSYNTNNTHNDLDVTIDKLINELKHIDNELENMLNDYFLNKSKEIKNSLEN